MIWRKATASEPNGACVELADLGDRIGLRDSKDPDGPTLTLSRELLGELIEAAKTGQLDSFS